MEYDVVIVGAGPSGLATAIRLKQLAATGGAELSVVDRASRRCARAILPWSSLASPFGKTTRAAIASTTFTPAEKTGTGLIFGPRSITPRNWRRDF